MRVYEALQWVGEMRIQNVVLETNSLNVTNALNENVDYYSEVGITLVEGCQEMLNKRTDVRAQHVGRQVK